MATTSGQLLKSLCGHLPPQTATAWAVGAGGQSASRRLPGTLLGSAVQQPQPALSFLSTVSAVAPAAAGGPVAAGGGAATTGGGALLAAAARTAAAKAAPQQAAEAASLPLTKTLIFSTQTSACRRRKQMAFLPAPPALGESRSALSSSVPLSFLRAKPMAPVPSSTANLPRLSTLTPLAVSPLAPAAAAAATAGAAAVSAGAVAALPPAALAEAQAGRARLLAPPFHHRSGLGFWSKSWLSRSRRQLQQDEQLQLPPALPRPHALFPMWFGHWSEDWLKRSRGSLWSPSSALTSLLSSMTSASRSSSSPTTLPPLSSSSNGSGVRVAAAAVSAVASSSKRRKVKARPTTGGSSDKNNGRSIGSSSSNSSSNKRRGKRIENYGNDRSSSNGSSSRSSGNAAKGVGSPAADAIGGSSRPRVEAAGLRERKRVSEPQAASPLMSKSNADTSARSSRSMELAWVPTEQATTAAAAAAASADGAAPPNATAPPKAPKAFVLRGGEHGIESTRIPNYVWNVLRALKFEGYEAYLVGGSVRDLYLQRPPKDFDVLTSASVKEVARVFKRRARVVGSRFPICHVWGPHGVVVEVSSFGQKPAQHAGKKAVGSKADINGNDSDPHTRLHGEALMQALQHNAAAEAVAAREAPGAEARALVAASAALAASGEHREAVEAKASVERQQQEEEEEGRVRPRIVHPRGYEWSERDTIRWIDAQRRDFTVNSLFYEPLSRTLYDYMGGLKDMKKKRINAIKPPEQLFVEDPARILRAIRLSARLRYELSPAIDDYLKSDAIDLPRIISTLDRSRVTQELTNMMCYGSAAVSMRLLAHYNLLTHLLPLQGKSLEEDGTMEALKRDALTPTHFLLDVMRALDSSAAPDKPCDAGLWLALLAFDMAFRAAPPHTFAAWAACTPAPPPPAASPAPPAGSAPHPTHAGDRNEEAETERHGEDVAVMVTNEGLQSVEGVTGDGGEGGRPGSGGRVPSAAVVAAAAKTVELDAAAWQQEDLVQEALSAWEDLKSRHGFDPKGEDKGASTSSSTFLEDGGEEGAATVSGREVGEGRGASFSTSGGPLHQHHHHLHHHHTPTYSGDVVAVAVDGDHPVHVVDGVVLIADDHHDHRALADMGLGHGQGGGFRADVIQRWQRGKQAGAPVSVVDKDEEEQEIAMREDRGVPDVDWMVGEEEEEEEVEEEVEEEDKEVEGQHEAPKPGPTAVQMAAKKMSERAFAYVRLMELQRPQVHFTKAVAAEARKILKSPFVVDFLDSGRTQPHKHEKRRTREGGVVFVECAMLALRNHKRRLQQPDSSSGC